MANDQMTLNIVKSIVYHLNDNNLKPMAEKMSLLKIRTDKQLDNVAQVIHLKALQRFNFTKLYAQLCAHMITDPWTPEDQKTKFKTFLYSKCNDVFYSYKKENKKSLEKSNFKYSSFNNDGNNALANCIFISELYNKGVISTEIVLSFMTDLSKEISNVQIRCLCEMMKLAGPKLSKTKSMTKFVGHLLLLKSDNSMCSNLSSEIKLLIDNIKKMHLNHWIYEDPDKLVRERLSISDNISLKKPLTNSQLKMYEYNMMADYIFNECNNLLTNFVEERCSNKPCKEIKHLLTPALHALLEENQVSFIVSLTLASIKKKLEIRILTSELLTNLCNTSLLSSYLVTFSFDKISKYYDDDDNDMKSIIKEMYESFKSQLLKSGSKMLQLIF